MTTHRRQPPGIPTAGTMTIRNASAYLGTTEHHVRILVRAGRLRTPRAADPTRSSRWRVYARDVANYLDVLQTREEESYPKPLRERSPSPSALPHYAA